MIFWIKKKPQTNKMTCLSNCLIVHTSHDYILCVSTEKQSKKKGEMILNHGGPWSAKTSDRNRKCSRWVQEHWMKILGVRQRKSTIVCYACRTCKKRKKYDGQTINISVMYLNTFVWYNKWFSLKQTQHEVCSKLTL